jgi:hypothetical protein
LPAAVLKRIGPPPITLPVGPRPIDPLDQLRWFPLALAEAIWMHLRTGRRGHGERFDALLRDQRRTLATARNLQRLKNFRPAA